MKCAYHGCQQEALNDLCPDHEALKHKVMANAWESHLEWVRNFKKKQETKK